MMVGSSRASSSAAPATPIAHNNQRSLRHGNADSKEDDGHCEIHMAPMRCALGLGASVFASPRQRSWFLKAPDVRAGIPTPARADLLRATCQDKETQVASGAADTCVTSPVACAATVSTITGVTTVAATTTSPCALLGSLGRTAPPLSPVPRLIEGQGPTADTYMQCAITPPSSPPVPSSMERWDRRATHSVALSKAAVTSGAREIDHHRRGTVVPSSAGVPLNSARHADGNAVQATTFSPPSGGAVGSSSHRHCTSRLSSSSSTGRRATPREYIVEEISPQRARELTKGSLGPYSDSPRNMQSPHSPALLLSSHQEDQGSTEKLSGRPRSDSSISLSSDEGVIKLRLHQALQLATDASVITAEEQCERERSPSPPVPHVLSPPLSNRRHEEAVPTPASTPSGNSANRFGDCKKAVGSLRAAMGNQIGGGSPVVATPRAAWPQSKLEASSFRAPLGATVTGVEASSVRAPLGAIVTGVEASSVRTPLGAAVSSLEGSLREASSVRTPLGAAVSSLEGSQTPPMSSGACAAKNIMQAAGSLRGGGAWPSPEPTIAPRAINTAGSVVTSLSPQANNTGYVNVMTAPRAPQLSSASTAPAPSPRPVSGPNRSCKPCAKTFTGAHVPLLSATTRANLVAPGSLPAAVGMPTAVGTTLTSPSIAAVHTPRTALEFTPRTIHTPPSSAAVHTPRNTLEFTSRQQSPYALVSRISFGNRPGIR